MNYTLALFGEAERGEFQTAYYCKNLSQLSDYLGEPPTEESRGLHFAIQALLYERRVLFIRVHEEGFSLQDYLEGLSLLEKKEIVPQINAICLPGVGSPEIIEATSNVCYVHKSFLIFTENDLYDYLTTRNLR